MGGRRYNFDVNRPFAHFQLDSNIIHFTCFDMSYCPLVQAKSPYFMQSFMKITYIFPIICTKFECFRKFSIWYKIILWFFTRFKYLQIIRKLYSNSLSFLLLLHGSIPFYQCKGIKSELCKWSIDFRYVYSVNNIEL